MFVYPAKIMALQEISLRSEKPRENRGFSVGYAVCASRSIAAISPAVSSRSMAPAFSLRRAIERIPGI